MLWYINYKKEQYGQGNTSLKKKGDKQNCSIDAFFIIGEFFHENGLWSIVWGA